MFTEIKELVVDRYINGCDYGANQRILIQNAQGCVYWLPGHKAWMNRMIGYDYVPGELFFRENSRGRILDTRIKHSENVRCNTLLKMPEVLQQIADCLKVDVACLPPLKLGKTFVENLEINPKK